MIQKSARDASQKLPKKQWTAPKLISFGKLSAQVLQGGGKITIIVGDPGEPRKVGPTG